MMGKKSLLIVFRRNSSVPKVLDGTCFPFTASSGGDMIDIELIRYLPERGSFIFLGNYKNFYL
jgi:hypothetical protein